MQGRKSGFEKKEKAQCQEHAGSPGLTDDPDRAAKVGGAGDAQDLGRPEHTGHGGEGAPVQGHE